MVSTKNAKNHWAINKEKGSSMHNTKNAKNQWIINKDKELKHDNTADDISSERPRLSNNQKHHDKQRQQMQKINKMINDHENRSRKT